MKIDELIQELEQVKEEHGNLEVKVEPNREPYLGKPIDATLEL